MHIKAQTSATPYSHGLEKNYVVETIDLKTVRPFTRAVKTDSPSAKKPSIPILGKQFYQLAFRFGPRFDGAIPSLRLHEQIDIINLSPLAKQALKASKIHTLQDLTLVKNELLKIKGIGLGHIDEIHEKLERYLGPSPLEPVDAIDLASLISLMLADVPAAARTLLLTSYQLQHCLPTSASELNEAQRIKAHARTELIHAAKTTIHHKREQLLAILQMASDAFLVPFMQKRLGIAERFELEECFFQHAVNGRIPENRRMVRLVEDILELPYIFHPFLASIAHKAYAMDIHTQQRACKAIEKAKEYFYSPATSFELPKLIWFLERDFAKQWVQFPEGFILKALRLSDSFELYRRGSLFIKLNHVFQA